MSGIAFGTAVFLWHPALSLAAEAPAQFVAQVTDEQTLPIEIAAEDCFFTADFYAQLKSGVYFLYLFLNQQMGLEFPADAKLKIRIFGSRESYQNYDQSLRSSDIESVGVYSFGTNEIAVLRQATDAQTLATVLHESVHAFLRQASSHIPRWIHEGIAEYFETLQFVQGQAVVAPEYGYDEAVKAALAGGKMLNLAGFLQITDRWESFFSHQSVINEPYGMGWSLIYFLMSSAEGRGALRSILQHLVQNPQTEGASLESFGMYYPGGLDQIEKDWRVWIPERRALHTYEFDSTAYAILNS